MGVGVFAKDHAFTGYRWRPTVDRSQEISARARCRTLAPGGASSGRSALAGTFSAIAPASSRSIGAGSDFSARRRCPPHCELVWYYGRSHPSPPTSTDRLPLLCTRCTGWRYTNAVHAMRAVRLSRACRNRRRWIAAANSSSCRRDTNTSAPAPMGKSRRENQGAAFGLDRFMSSPEYLRS
jgi:hypothetical protein